MSLSFSLLTLSVVVLLSAIAYQRQLNLSRVRSSLSVRSSGNGQLEAHPAKNRQWFKVVTRANETNGAYYEIEEYHRLEGCGSGPQSVCAPPMHVHFQQEETFTVLKGKFNYIVEGTSGTLGVGESVTVPVGKSHTWFIQEGSNEDVHVR